VAGGIGAAVGGGSGAATGANVDRFNRQLHPDERKWAKDNAKEFAEFYAERTDDPISVSDAENMLLSGGYRLVDAVANKAPGADRAATEFISMHGGDLFSATDAERRNTTLYGNTDGSPTPEQRAINVSHTPNLKPQPWAVSAGIYLGVGGEIEIGFTGISPTATKLGLGVGIGAHGWMRGTSHGANADIFRYGDDAKSGDYRIGSSAAGNVFFGPVSGKIGVGGGLYSNIKNKPETGTYGEARIGAGISPTTGVGAEGKANLFEFSCKRK